MLVMWLLFGLIVMFMVYLYVRFKKQYKLSREIFMFPQQENIYNISGRVQGAPNQYPDAYLSVEHITITNELNKPPKYDDAPPSYEEAIKLAMATSNSLQTHQAESQGTSTATATAAIVPAVPNSRTE